MKVKLLVFILISLLGVTYFIYDPSEYRFYLKCPFYFLSGYKCPGCGSQRAFHELLHLRLAAALKENLLFVISIPFISIYLIAGKSAINHIMSRKWILLVASSVVVAWWILRNVIDQ